MTREERQTIKKNIAAAVEAHQQNRASGPRATVSAHLDQIALEMMAQSEPEPEDQPSEEEKKLEALKAHLIEEEEATAEELAPCTVENTYNPNWDTFEIIGREYRVMTETEADAAARESILDYAWAFNPEFVLSHTAFYETSTPSDDRTFCDALRRLQRDLCESAAPLIRALIRDPDEFVRDAIAADGRGHFLSLWDGEEYESGPYFIYRTN